MSTIHKRNMLSFQIEQDGDQFHAWCPELPECHTHGKTRQEAMAHLKDAIVLYVEDVMEENLLEDTVTEAA